MSPDTLSIPSSTHKVALTHRSLVQVRGEDTMKLFQGLVTADVTTMGRPFKSLYSVMLNAQVPKIIQLFEEIPVFNLPVVCV